ncbi:hypothetical protein GQ457_13G016840 [Hibiscus cannabinus]
MFKTIWVPKGIISSNKKDDVTSSEGKNIHIIRIERGNNNQSIRTDTCLGGLKRWILDKKLKLFRKSEKSADLRLEYVFASVDCLCLRSLLQHKFFKMFRRDKPRAKKHDTSERRTEPSRTEHTLAIPNFKIPSFEGKYDPDGYCDWENRVDFMFDFYGYPEEDQVSLVTLIFKNYAAIWWQNICRKGETKIRTWAELKKVMRERFAPIHYLRNIRHMREKRDHDAREAKEKVEIVSTYEHEVSKRHVTTPKASATTLAFPRR